MHYKPHQEMKDNRPAKLGDGILSQKAAARDARHTEHARCLLWPGRQRPIIQAQWNQISMFATVSVSFLFPFLLSLLLFVFDTARSSRSCFPCLLVCLPVFFLLLGLKLNEFWWRRVVV